MARSDKPAEERRQIANALSAATVHALDRDIAAKAGELDGRLTDEGTRIRAADTIIAATALHHGEPVLTNNVKHFSRIEGLDVHSYDTSSG